jgi:hypothetical protein
MSRNIFLDASNLLKQNNGLNYINYDRIKEEGKEFLRTDVWDFTFTVPPAAVYFPGNDLLKVRCSECQPQFPASLSEISATIRQFTIRQSVMSGTTSGGISLTYTDREDQAISAFIDDWRDKISGRNTRYSFRKEDTVAEGVLTMYNSTRHPIREYLCHSLQPESDMSGTLNPSFNSDDPQNAGTCNLSLRFEHFELIWKNI